MLDAYARFLDKPLKQDPSCFAKKAIARALGRARLQRHGVLIAAVCSYRQLEPVWGGTADTAVDVRASCAMGLVASGYSRALVELTALVNDADAAARVGAVRAIACGNPREAELLLRSKVLAGDAEPQVLGECFTGLLAVEPEESIGFVAGYLAHADEAVRELAALALGESRLDGALAPLQEAWDERACSATSCAARCCGLPPRIAARRPSTGCSRWWRKRARPWRSTSSRSLPSTGTTASSRNDCAASSRPAAIGR